VIPDDTRRRIRHAIETQRPLHWTLAEALLDALEEAEAEGEGDPIGDPEGQAAGVPQPQARRTAGAQRATAG
jgi:hypothetical protein